MLYNQFQDKQLPSLGFGIMRLPKNEDGSIHEDKFREMLQYAMEQGVCYFDTAWPYHEGESERVLGKMLHDYDRNSFFLADKFPGHELRSSYDPAAIFEEQLKKCGVDYFDFYLLHNVHESSIDTYLDPRWGIIEYLKEQRRIGRIRHLGFSCHMKLDGMRRFLELHGKDMEFCQIQLNYIDWTLQEAKEKCDLLNEYQLPIWVMEPVRGGKLASLHEGAEAKLKELRPDESIPAWAFRFLQSIPNVKVILSGMSTMEQMQDNVKTLSTLKPLSQSEQDTLMEIAEEVKNAIPCTACRYCCTGCPKELDIPSLLSFFNDLRFRVSLNSSMSVYAMPKDKLPSACIGCGKCTKVCPQNIDIPNLMKELSYEISQLPDWVELCRQREQATSQI